MLRWPPSPTDDLDVDSCRNAAAISGRWVSDREFVLDLDPIAEVNHFVFRLTFECDEWRIVDESRAS